MAAARKASECDHAADVYRHKAHQIRETPRMPGMDCVLLHRKPLSMTGCVFRVQKETIGTG
jgi:hypothetical protein